MKIQTRFIVLNIILLLLMCILLLQLTCVAGVMCVGNCERVYTKNDVPREIYSTPPYI
jgi:hypothetical protein